MLGGAVVGGLSARASLGEILRARIRAEAADYNSAPGPLFQGLVQPADAIRHSDGHHMGRPRQLDPDRLVAAAEEAVAAGMLSFQLATTTVSDLDHQLVVDEHDEVIAVLERPVIARA